MHDGALCVVHLDIHQPSCHIEHQVYRHLASLQSYLPISHHIDQYTSAQSKTNQSYSSVPGENKTREEYERQPYKKISKSRHIPRDPSKADTLHKQNRPGPVPY